MRFQIAVIRLSTNHTHPPRDGARGAEGERACARAEVEWRVASAAGAGVGGFWWYPAGCTASEFTAALMLFVCTAVCNRAHLRHANTAPSLRNQACAPPLTCPPAPDTWGLPCLPPPPAAGPYLRCRSHSHREDCYSRAAAGCTGRIATATARSCRRP